MGRGAQTKVRDKKVSQRSATPKRPQLRGRKAATQSYPKPSRPLSATLASPYRWARFRTAPQLVDEAVVASLTAELHVKFLLDPGYDEEDVRIDGAAFEAAFARALRLRARRGKGHYDVEPNFDLDPDNRPDRALEMQGVAWELKVLSELSQAMSSPDDVGERDRTIFTRVSLDEAEVEMDMDATEAGARLFAVMGERAKHAQRERHVSDSRIAYLSTKVHVHEDGTREPMALLWEEPYYPQDLKAEALQWSWEAKSLVGRMGTDIAWQWYPSRNGGHVRHYPTAPEGARVIGLPLRDERLDATETAQMHEMLFHTAAGQQLASRQRRLAEAGYDVAPM